MKKFVASALMALLVFSTAGSVAAWELKMKGETEWRYRYWTRTGSSDIFGYMDPTAVNLGINHLSTFPTGGTQTRGGSTFGVIAGENNFGSDMSATEYRMTVFPQIKVNKAIKVSASVNLTSLGIYSDGQPLVGGLTNLPNPVNPGYVNTLYVPISTRSAGADIPNTYVTLQWLKTSIKTPMLDFSIGYKTSGLGMGLWKHKRNRASASFGVKAKFGPLTFAFSPYFSRRNSDWLQTSRNEGDSAPQRKERIRNYFRALMGSIKYANGPLVIHLVSDSYIEDAAPDTDVRFTAITPGRPANRDRIRYRFHLSSSYNNGRFFFNSEADWFNSWRSGRATANAPAGTTRQGNDVKNSWLYGIDFGCVVGPTKATLNYVRSTGDDPSTRHAEDSLSGDSGVNDGYIGDWGYLMYHLYGTGNNFGADGYGFPYDFHHVGVRIDRAIASNLNVWVLYSQAWGDSPTGWTLGGDGIGGVRQFRNDDLLALQAGGVRRPCPDSARDIGWEVDLGVNWQLLENLTWNTTVDYWKPGTWWSYAFPNTAAIYRANGGAAIVAADYPNASFALGRGIDPLVAVETNLLINF
jgi:hypothetical protein